MYNAQKGTLFCENPRKEAGNVKVAQCIAINGRTAEQVAEILAERLNAPIAEKNRALRKDEHLEIIYEYMVSVDSKDIPGFIRDAFHRAYEI